MENTLMMETLIKEKYEELKDLCKQYHVKELHLFGSAVSSDFDGESDIDFLVSFYPLDFGDYADNYFAFANKLEQLFNRKVDLVTVNSLSNPYFKKSIEETKQLVYG